MENDKMKSVAREYGFHYRVKSNLRSQTYTKPNESDNMYVARKVIIDGHFSVDDSSILAEKTGLNDEEKKFLRVFEDTLFLSTKAKSSTNKVDYSLELKALKSIIYPEGDDYVESRREMIGELYPEFRMKQLFNEKKTMEKVVTIIKKDLNIILTKINETDVLEEIYDKIVSTKGR